jgi:zinc D-Ala-D-Ala carboxypeptidase
MTTPRGTACGILLCGILASTVLVPWQLAAAGISDEFAISTSELATLTGSLPDHIRAAIRADPREFLHLVAGVLNQPADLFVLVDKKHPLPADFVPGDLVSVTSYSLAVSMGHVLLRKTIMPAVLELEAAANKSGITLVFSSGYRSFEYQKFVYAREVTMYGQETADRESARPGMSQHQLGTAIDFGSITDDFAGTPAGRWLADHAGDYGFSLSYPQGYERETGYRYESWHYRFITKQGALLQKRYFGDVQQYLLQFLHEHRAVLESRRRPSSRPRRSSDGTRPAAGSPDGVQ